MNKNKPIRYIFSMRLAGYLMQNGFRLIRIHHNLKYRGRDVYLFYDSPEIQEKMEEYSTQRRCV